MFAFFFFKSSDNVPLSTVKLRLTRCVSLIYLVKSFASHGVIWVLEQSVKYQLSTGFRNLQSSRIPVLLKLIRGFSVLFDSLLVCRIIYRKRKKKTKTRISNIFKHECDQKSIIFPNHQISILFSRIIINDSLDYPPKNYSSIPINAFNVSS